MLGQAWPSGRPTIHISVIDRRFCGCPEAFSSSKGQDFEFDLDPKGPNPIKEQGAYKKLIQNPNFGFIHPITSDQNREAQYLN